VLQEGFAQAVTVGLFYGLLDAGALFGGGGGAADGFNGLGSFAGIALDEGD